MESIVEELLAKIAAEPRVSARGGVRAARGQARADLGMVLFAEREAIAALWEAADAAVRESAGAATADLAEAVERLRPLFGPRK